MRSRITGQFQNHRVLIVRSLIVCQVPMFSLVAGTRRGH